jgi:DnaK suppressor protein
VFAASETPDENWLPVTRDESMRVLGAVSSEHERTVAQIASLERSVAFIVEASELTATDDEHDPEGTTIAYERAQAISLLRQARLDLDRLVNARRRLESGEAIICESCRREIDTERLLALPTTRTCIHCAA